MEKLELICENKKSWDSVFIYQFPTAFTMIRNEFEGKEDELKTKLRIEDAERGLDVYLDDI